SLNVNSQNTSSIVIGSFGAMSNAERQKQTLIKEGFDNIDISKVGNVYRVSVLVSGSKEKVQEVHKRVKVYHKSAWISYN
ncbi:SPOR domain-containing protein, partial [bacterium]|nr:SPOR domain-containing protein [bacterium]